MYIHTVYVASIFLSVNRIASIEASHSAELKAVQQRTEAAESSLALKEAELNRAKEKVHTYTAYSADMYVDTYTHVC